MWLFSILVLIFAIILVSGIHARGHEHDAFMSKAQTTSLRGLAILIVVIHHLGQRLDSALPLTLYLMNFFIGYLAVGLFFFLSGYGNMLSISHMQRSFAGKMAWIVKRIIGLLLIFYVAEAMALICEFIMYRRLDSVKHFVNLDSITISYSSQKKIQFYRKNTLPDIDYVLYLAKAFVFCDPSIAIQCLTKISLDSMIS